MPHLYGSACPPGFESTLFSYNLKARLLLILTQNFRPEPRLSFQIMFKCFIHIHVADSGFLDHVFHQ